MVQTGAVFSGLNRIRLRAISIKKYSKNPKKNWKMVGGWVVSAWKYKKLEKVFLYITLLRYCWTMKKKDEMLMNKTEMRMLRWIQGVSLREHKRNEDIREAATVQPITTHLMQKRLRWYGQP